MARRMREWRPTFTWFVDDGIQDVAVTVDADVVAMTDF